MSDQMTFEELEEMMHKHAEGVPFGNSAFQTQFFILNQHEGLPRKYRTILLQFNKVMENLARAKISREKMEIQIKLDQSKLEKQKDPMKRRLIELSIEDRRISMRHEDKLIKDALMEAHAFGLTLKDMQKMSREEFEKAEFDYWRDRLTGDAEIELLTNGRIDKGTLISMRSMGMDIYKLIPQIHAAVALQAKQKGFVISSTLAMQSLEEGAKETPEAPKFINQG